LRGGGENAAAECRWFCGRLALLVLCLRALGKHGEVVFGVEVGLGSRCEIVPEGGGDLATYGKRARNGTGPRAGCLVLEPQRGGGGRPDEIHRLRRIWRTGYLAPLFFFLESMDDIQTFRAGRRSPFGPNGRAVPGGCVMASALTSAGQMTQGETARRLLCIVSCSGGERKPPTALKGISPAAIAG